MLSQWLVLGALHGLQAALAPVVRLRFEEKMGRHMNALASDTAEDADERTEADHPSARRVLFAYPRPLVATLSASRRVGCYWSRHYEGDADDRERLLPPPCGFATAQPRAGLHLVFSAWWPGP